MNFNFGSIFNFDVNIGFIASKPELKIAIESMKLLPPLLLFVLFAAL